MAGILALSWRGVDLEQLRRDGYTVAEGVAGPELIEPLLALAQDVSGVRLDEESTWRREEEILPLWGHQAQWDLRQSMPVYEAFAAAYGEVELASSQDRMGVKVPGHRGMRIHHDVDPHDAPRVYGGLVYLTDTPPERGAFRCVPQLFREREDWLRRHPDAGVDVVDPEGCEIVSVPGRAGDLVMWDVRLPHANGDNASDLPRVVQYVSLFPHGAWGEERADHIELWQSRRALPAWRDLPGHGGMQPWPPAELDEHGRRLIGLDPY
jgi:hypothetical protein